MGYDWIQVGIQCGSRVNPSAIFEGFRMEFRVGFWIPVGFFGVRTDQIFKWNDRRLIFVFHVGILSVSRIHFQFIIVLFGVR